MRKIILAIAATAILSGCTSVAESPRSAVSAPAEQLFKFQNRQAGNAELVIVRDGGTFASPCLTTIFLNGEKIAKLSAGQKASFFLNEGEFNIGAALEGGGLCGIGKPMQEREVVLKAGAVKYYRVFFDNSGYTDIKPTSMD